jgi:hypothetical protein
MAFEVFIYSFWCSNNKIQGECSGDAASYEKRLLDVPSLVLHDDEQINITVI